MTLVGARPGVEHNDAAVAVTVCNKHLVGFVIHGNAGRPAQVRSVVAVDAHVASSDLQQKLSVLGELEDLTVAVAVTGEPDIVFSVNGDTVLPASGTPIPIQAPFVRARLALGECRMQSSTIEPLIPALSRRAAPSLDVLAVGVEFDNRQSRHASILCRASFFEGVGTMKYPDVSVRVRGPPANVWVFHRPHTLEEGSATENGYV